MRKNKDTSKYPPLRIALKEVTTDAMPKHYTKLPIASKPIISFSGYPFFLYLISAISQKERNILPYWFGMKSYLLFPGFVYTVYTFARLACFAYPCLRNIPVPEMSVS